MFNRIRWRLTAWYVAILAAILLAFGTGVYVVSARQLMAGEDEQLRLAAQHEARKTLKDLSERDHDEEHTDSDGDHQNRSETDNGSDEFDEDSLSVGFVWTYSEAGKDYMRRKAPLQLDFFPHRSSLTEARSAGHPVFATIQWGKETVRLYSLPVRDMAGRPVALVQSAKPITPLQHNLDQILLTLLLTGTGGLILAAGGGLFLSGRALVPIRQAFQRQREFVADASHELRTPLAIVRAAADVLQKEQGPEAPTAELVDDIRSESERMARMVSDLLTLARADSGERDVKPDSCDLVPITESALRKVSLLAREKGLALASSLPAALPAEADPDRLEQLLIILLDNAIKYTDPGGQVKLTLTSRANRAEIAVQDTGIGIPPEEIPHIFDRFYRVDKARSRQQGGTGLGLAIARWITQAHRGDIHVESVPGRGTTFTVSLPLGQHPRGNHLS